MQLSQGKVALAYFFVNIICKIKKQKKGRKKNKWPLDEALVFSEIRHIKTNPKNGGVLIDEERFCVAGRGEAGFGKRVEL